MIYIFLFIVLLFGSVYFTGNRQDRNNYYLFFEYVVIVLIFGLRYKVGGDTLNYYDQFPNWPTLDEISRFDLDSHKYNIGWMYFSAVCKYIYNDFVVVQLIQSAIVNAAFFYFFKRNVKNYFTAIFLYGLMYIFIYNTEIMRAALVVSIFLFGYNLYVKKKWIKYYVLCCIAFLFHSEAVVMFILPICHPLSKIKPSIFNLSVFTVICILSVLLFNFVPYLLSLFSGFERVMTTFTLYSDMTYEANLNGYISHLFFTIPWLLFLWITRSEETPLLWRGFVLLYIFFSFLQLRYTEFMVRACDCLYPFTIVAMTDVLYRRKYIRDNFIKLAISLCIMIAVGQRIYSNFSNEHWKLFYPYSSILDPEENYERNRLLREFQKGF